MSDKTPSAESRQIAAAAAPAAPIMPITDAEILAMRLHGSPAKSAVSYDQQVAEQSDARVQLAKNLDHIDEISAQLQEIHSLIDPKDALFAQPADDGRFTFADDTKEVPLWHGPAAATTVELQRDEFGNTTEPEEFEEPAPRSSALRRRLVPIAVAAAVLAIPTLVVAAAQPWHSSPSDTQTVDSRGDDPAAAYTPPLDTGSAVGSTADQPLTTPGASDTPQLDEQGKPLPVPNRVPVPQINPKRGEVAPLVVTASGPASVTQNEAASFTVDWTDGSGYFGELSYAAASVGGPAKQVASEISDCSGTAPASHGSKPVSIPFSNVGSETVTFTLTTYTCDGARETSQVTVNVDVKPAQSPSDPTTPTSTSPSKS